MIFLKIEGIDGNSEVEGYEKWIEVESFSWGCSNQSNVGHGAGASASTSQTQALNISLLGAKSSVNLIHFCTIGKHLPEVKLETTKATGDKEEKNVAIHLKTAYISSVSQSGSPGYVNDSVSIDFEEYVHEVFEQNDKGVLASAGKHGFNQKTRKYT